MLIISVYIVDVQTVSFLYLFGDKFFCPNKSRFQTENVLFTHVLQCQVLLMFNLLVRFFEKVFFKKNHS